MPDPAGKVDDLLSFNGGAMNFENKSTPSHGNAGAKEVSKRGVDASFFLSKFERVGGVREFFVTFFAPKSLNRAGLTSAKIEPVFDHKNFAAMEWA